MLSRSDIRPKQTRLLLAAGFLPVSIDYRLCPEMTLLEGPMRDVCDALAWARNTLPFISTLRRPDVLIDGGRVVAVGWSTGGHLAMSLGWTAPKTGIRPPEAVLAFYCPSDYEDPFWMRPNLPRGAEHFAAEVAAGNSSFRKAVCEGVRDRPMTAYRIPSSTVQTPGGWCAPADARSRIALHMNVQGKTVEVLCHGLARSSTLFSTSTQAERGTAGAIDLPRPTQEQIVDISPLAQIRKGAFKTPTFIIHGAGDDLIPWKQAKRTYEALVTKGVQAELRIVEGAVHLFDVYPGFEEKDAAAAGAVEDGYKFLKGMARL